MKAMYIPFELSKVETPSGNRVPIRGKESEITRMDVEIFAAGSMARLVFWTQSGEQHSILLTTPSVATAADKPPTAKA